MSRHRLTGFARRVGTPVRVFFNQHFEAVKDEVRRTAAQHAADTDARMARYDVTNAGRIAALTHRVDELDDHVAELIAVVAELRTANDRLVAVVAGVLDRPDDRADDER